MKSLSAFLAVALFSACFSADLNAQCSCQGSYVPQATYSSTYMPTQFNGYSTYTLNTPQHYSAQGFRLVGDVGPNGIGTLPGVGRIPANGTIIGNGYNGNGGYGGHLIGNAGYGGGYGNFGYGQSGYGNGRIIGYRVYVRPRNMFNPTPNAGGVNAQLPAINPEPVPAN